MPAHPSTRRLVGAGLLTAALASGCATTPAPVVPQAIEDAATVPEPDPSEFVPVVRYGRYTLVELAPMAQQRDLLLQTVDVSIPEDARATVGDGLRHVLKRSGYQLCDTTQAQTALYPLPLPAAHLHLGPMSLRDALLTLAGPAWALQTDDRTRQVCFAPVAGEPGTTPGAAPPSVKAIQPFPLTEGQQ